MGLPRWVSILIILMIFGDKKTLPMKFKTSCWWSWWWWSSFQCGGAIKNCTISTYTVCHMLMQASIATNLVYFFAQPGNQWSAKKCHLAVQFHDIVNIPEKCTGSANASSSSSPSSSTSPSSLSACGHLWSWDTIATAKKYCTLHTISQFNAIMLISIFAQQWPSVGWRAIKHWLESTAIKLSGFKCFSAQFEIVRKTIYLQDRFFITAAIQRCGWNNCTPQWKKTV